MGKPNRKSDSCSRLSLFFKKREPGYELGILVRENLAQARTKFIAVELGWIRAPSEMTLTFSFHGSTSYFWRIVLFLHESMPRLLQPARSNAKLFIFFFERRKYRVLFFLWMYLAFRGEHPELHFLHGVSFPYFPTRCIVSYFFFMDRWNFFFSHEELHVFL